VDDDARDDRKQESPEQEASRKRLERARQIVRNKIGFIKHFVVYALVLVALAVLNNTTAGGYQWWIWIAFGWGIGVVSHFLSAFVFRGGDLEERLIRRELERMDRADEEKLD